MNVLRMVGLSLAMGVLTVGCGGPVESEQAEAASLQSREDAIPDCSVGGPYTAFYSDGSYTTQIGGRGCDCGTWVNWGKTSTFRQSSSDYCGWDVRPR